MQIQHRAPPVRAGRAAPPRRAGSPRRAHDHQARQPLAPVPVVAVLPAPESTSPAASCHGIAGRAGRGRRRPRRPPAVPGRRWRRVPSTSRNRTAPPGGRKARSRSPPPRWAPGDVADGDQRHQPGQKTMLPSEKGARAWRSTYPAVAGYSVGHRTAITPALLPGQPGGLACTSSTTDTANSASPARPNRTAHDLVRLPPRASDTCIGSAEIARCLVRAAGITAGRPAAR